MSKLDHGNYAKILILNIFLYNLSLVPPLPTFHDSVLVMGILAIQKGSWEAGRREPCLTFIRKNWDLTIQIMVDSAAYSPEFTGRFSAWFALTLLIHFVHHILRLN